MQAAVYNKALRRKDASGLAAKKEDEAKDKDGADEKKDEKKEEKKSNADTGKIVNLMASEWGLNWSSSNKLLNKLKATAPVSATRWLVSTSSMAVQSR